MPNYDRSPDMMPTQSGFMRYVSSYAPTKRYNDASKMGASPVTKKSFKEIIQEKSKDPNNKGAKALAPLLRFCGGMSKAYKMKK